jgi:UDP-N-acetyl-D-glucosamine dehydrogenase
VNIALVNELAMLADEMAIDIWEVVDAAATKPFGFQPFYPGIGPGGHCIPVDPYYLAWRARQYDFQTKFIELAADVNLRMANYTVTRIQRFLNRQGRLLAGAHLACYGVSFKPGVGDTRNSRAVRVVQLLEQHGARVSAVDPFVAEFALGGELRKTVEPTAEMLASCDAAVVLVAHQEIDYRALVATEMLVFDAVNATRGLTATALERL